MNPQLRTAIEAYVSASQELFTQLANDLGVSLPIKAHDWAMQEIEWSGISQSGIKYNKHGYGVSMRLENVIIDFDLGKNGELNGVDPWRLFYFSEDNNFPIPYTSTTQVQEEFKSLEQSGELVYSGYILYYLAEST
jgi:hypothetical protein